MLASVFVAAVTAAPARAQPQASDARSILLEEETETVKTRTNRNAPLLRVIKSRDRLDEALGLCRQAVESQASRSQVRLYPGLRPAAG
jgi:hypothetical protein